SHLPTGTKQCRLVRDDLHLRARLSPCDLRSRGLLAPLATRSLHTRQDRGGARALTLKPRAEHELPRVARSRPQTEDFAALYAQRGWRVIGGCASPISKRWRPPPPWISVASTTGSRAISRLLHDARALHDELLLDLHLPTVSATFFNMEQPDLAGGGAS